MTQIPEFIILQNSRTKRSGVWNGKRWAYPPVEEYVFIETLAKLIRTDSDPCEVVRAIKNENE